MIELSYILIFEPIKTKTAFKSDSKSFHDLNPSFDLLRNSVLSLLHQSIGLWDLTIYAHAHLVDELKRFIRSIDKASEKILVLPEPSDEQERVTSSLLNFPTLINHALSLVKGRWVSVLPLGDILEPEATYILLKCALAKSNVALVYCDQDFYKLNHHIGQPCYKPNFSIDLLYSQNYIGNFFIFNKDVAIEIGRFDVAISDNWSYDLILRLLANFYLSSSTDNHHFLNKKISRHYFLHVAKVLHHQHIKNADDLFRGNGPSLKPSRLKTKSKQGLQSLKNHFASLGQNVLVSQVQPLIYRHDWSMSYLDEIDGHQVQPLVSIIIPTRDGYSILKACIDSIIEKTSYRNYEIIVIDNQSVDLKTIRYLDKMKSTYQNFRVLSYDKPFNYSDINNFAADHAKGSILGFVNNDIEVLTPDWLTEMVSHAMRPDIGCVGALLLYPDGTVQHGGVIVGMQGVADHAFKAVDPNDSASDYFDLLKSIHNPDAVTAATLLIRKALFDQVGRFDHKELVVAFNDVDLCLKVKKKGLRNLLTPYAKLIHHESKTRSKDVSLESRQREQYEHSVMKSRWKTHKIEKKHLLRAYLT